MTANVERYRFVADSLLSKMRASGFCGFDPFDGLNSRLFRATGLNGFPLARLAWLQFHKRSPLNLRKIVGVPAARNPKGVALVLLGLLYDYTTKADPSLLEEATQLGDWLLAQRCEHSIWGAAAWGYHFDWQAKAFYVPKGKPNIITTVYVSLALESLAGVSNDQRFAGVLSDAAEFIVINLFADSADGPFFRYVPGESALVHNANLWGAALVAHAGASFGRRDWLDIARKACTISARAQDERGAWPYGGRGHHAFVDSFHTGFNLEALHRYSVASGSDEFTGAIQKGLEYYREQMFLPDGTPKYYDNQVYPIDMHSAAQAVITLLEVSGSDSDCNLAEKILNWSIITMFDEKRGYFYYQKGKAWTNKIPYMRWTQAWMYYALAYFVNFDGRKRIK